MALAKAEEGKNRQNYDDEADDIDKSVHELAPLYLTPLLTDNLPAPAKFPSWRKNEQRLALGRRQLGRRIDAAMAGLGPFAQGGSF